MTRANDDRVREWEEGLPSPAELTPLSLSLISPALASAFSITSDQHPFRTMADVHRASESTFASLNRTASMSLPAFLSDPLADEGVDTTMDDPGAEESSDLCKHAHGISAALHGTGGFPGPSRLSNLSPGLHALDHKANGGPDAGAPTAAASVGAACVGATDSSEGTAKNTRIEADLEPEEAESGPGQDNSNEDQAARTLKRPRLVWTPELHKRFVEAVAHLGIKNAVPKTIMQLMNVEGLTRENVASHLQKYRIYLKRMQGLSTEGPTSSDQLFASTPVPPSLAASTRFLSGIPGHVEDAVPVPFATPHVQVPLGRPHVTANVNMGGPFSPLGPYTYNALARATPQRFIQGESTEALGNNQSQPASSSHHILRLFRAGSQ